MNDERLVPTILIVGMMVFQAVVLGYIVSQESWLLALGVAIFVVPIWIVFGRWLCQEWRD